MDISNLPMLWGLTTHYWYASVRPNDTACRLAPVRFALIERVL